MCVAKIKMLQKELQNMDIMSREFTLECYKHAVDNKYRFFSFGDSMFIHGK